MTPFARTLVQATIALAVILAIWTFASLGTEPFLLPTPNATLAKSASLLTSSEFLRHVGVSLMIFFQGFVPAAAIAIGLGIAAAKSQAIRGLAETIAIVPAAAPLVVFAVPLVLWHGIGAPSKTILVFLVSAFPMLQNFLAVLKSSRVAGTPATDTLGEPSAPASRRVPLAILSCLRLGLMLGVGAVIVGEIFASREGLGYLLTTYSASFDTVALMATLVVILVPSALIGVLLQAAEEQMAT